MCSGEAAGTGVSSAVGCRRGSGLQSPSRMGGIWTRRFLGSIQLIYSESPVLVGSVTLCRLS